MVTLTLSNHHKDPTYRHAQVNINTGLCTLDETVSMPLRQFMLQSDFINPFMTASHLWWANLKKASPKNMPHPSAGEPTSPRAPSEGDHDEQQTLDASTQVFYYEYDDLNGLFDAPTFVYSILLHVDNPTRCIFDLSPSSQFHHRSLSYDGIYFSPTVKRPSKEPIPIKTLEALVHKINQHDFKFSEEIILHQRLTFNDLPAQLSDDILLESHPDILSLLHSPRPLDEFEIRYIDPSIGFGVFSRVPILKDTPILIYTGSKVPPTIEDRTYCFESGKDCLSLLIDAKYQGNLSRFVNHAPKIEHESSTEDQLLYANLKAHHSNIHGLSVIVFTSTRDIACGEQLLIDYGAQYFSHKTKIGFTHDQQLMNPQNVLSQPQATDPLTILRLFASQGIPQAQRAIVFRWFKIISLVILCALILKLV